MSRKRNISSVFVAAILILCNVSIVAQDVATPLKLQVGRATPVLELHTTPGDTTPEDGLRESPPKELERIEQNSARNILPRYSAAMAWCWFPDHRGAACLGAPLLRIHEYCTIAKFIALAHANLSDRYPIPPPQTLR